MVVRITKRIRKVLSSTRATSCHSVLCLVVRLSSFFSSLYISSMSFMSVNSFSCAEFVFGWLSLTDTEAADISALAFPFALVLSQSAAMVWKRSDSAFLWKKKGV